MSVRPDPYWFCCGSNDPAKPHYPLTDTSILRRLGVRSPLCPDSALGRLLGALGMMDGDEA